jgi:hypothetical protein
MMEEEKAFETKAAAAKKPTGKKAKQYDAAEAQKKALMKSMAKMVISEEPKETENQEEEDEAQAIE